MTRHKLSGIGLLLMLVLIGHGLLLSWLGQQLQQLRPLVPMADPMWTRIVEPVRPPLPARQAQPRRQREAVPSSPASLADLPTPPATTPELAEQDRAERPREAEPEQAQAVAQADEPAPSVPAEDGPPSDGWPADTRVSYVLGGFYRGNLHGSARVQWQRAQDRYQVRLDLSMALVLRVSMISQGVVGADSLAPAVYEEQLPWGQRRALFDGSVVRFNDGAQVPQPPALQDTVSQFVELAHRFSSGRQVLKVGSEVSLWMARPQGMALWTYDVVEEEMLQTPELGLVPAFHLRPRPISNPTGVITAEIWFAPSLQYLPVRVRIALGEGNFVDLMVERIEQGATQPLPTGDLRQPLK